MVATEYRRKTYQLWLVLAVTAPLAFFAAIALTNQMQYGEPAPTWQDKTIAAYDDRFGMPTMLGGTAEDFILGGVNRACGLMTQDPDIPRTFDRLVDFGYSSDQSTFFIAAGTYYRCTEFAPLFDE